MSTADGEYFVVELAGRNAWALRCRAEVSYNHFTEDDRRRILRRAAESWNMRFGDLKA